MGDQIGQFQEIQIIREEKINWVNQIQERLLEGTERLKKLQPQTVNSLGGDTEN